MEIYLTQYRIEFKNILRRIECFEIEESFLTPMEVLQLKSIKKEVNTILENFCSNSTYLKIKP